MASRSPGPRFMCITTASTHGRRNGQQFVAQARAARVAASDADGRFQFELDKSASDFPYRDFPAWHGAQIAAVARAIGPAWVRAGSLLKGDEATIRLVRDDVSIRGRVLDPQGRPVGRGEGPRREIARDSGMTSTSMLASGDVDNDIVGAQSVLHPTWLGRQGTWTTDADGRFEIDGDRARPDRRPRVRRPDDRESLPSRWPAQSGCADQASAAAEPQRDAG